MFISCTDKGGIMGALGLLFHNFFESSKITSIFFLKGFCVIQRISMQRVSSFRSLPSERYNYIRHKELFERP